MFDVTDWILSDPYVRDISTISANPSLASQAPIDSRIILVNIDSDEQASSVTGINITNLSINASSESSDISRWFLLMIRAIMADNEHNLINIIYEFISMDLIIVI